WKGSCSPCPPPRAGGSLPWLAVPRDQFRGILAGPVDGPRRVRGVYPDVDAVPGLVVEHRHTRTRGRVVRIEGTTVVIRTDLGTERVLSLVPGAFAVDGRAVSLVRPRLPSADGP